MKSWKSVTKAGDDCPMFAIWDAGSSGSAAALGIANNTDGNKMINKLDFKVKKPNDAGFTVGVSFIDTDPYNKEEGYVPGSGFDGITNVELFNFIKVQNLRVSSVSADVPNFSGKKYALAIKW
jgi:hypothetical protein